MFPTLIEKNNILVAFRAMNGLIAIEYLSNRIARKEGR